MISRTLAPALVATLSLSLTACSEDSANSASDRPEVIAAFYPLQFVAERIVGDRAEVTSLTSPGVEPHDLELTPRQVARLSDAALAFYVSGFQPAVDRAIENSGPETTLDVAEVIEFREEGHDDDDHADDDHADDDHAEDDHAEDDHAEDDHSEDDHAEDDHDHEGGDPHFWLDPTLLGKVADEFTSVMATTDPANAEEYQANNTALQEDLVELDEEFRNGLAGCKTRSLVVSHDAFGYLGSRYDLTVYPIAGLSPDAEPSPKHLSELADLVRTEKITTVFSETLASPRLAETLADEVGISTAVLDPIEGLTDDNADADYLSVMRANLAAIQKADSCL